jgi:hypothetical protein
VNNVACYITLAFQIFIRSCLKWHTTVLSEATLFWCQTLQCNLKHSIYCFCSSVYYISSRISCWMSCVVNFLIPCIAGLLNEVLFYINGQNIYIRQWSCYISNLFVCFPVIFNTQLRCFLEYKKGWLYTDKQQKNLTFSTAVSDCFYRRGVERCNMRVSISVKFCKMCGCLWQKTCCNQASSWK